MEKIELNAEFLFELKSKNGPHGKRRGPAWRLPCCYGLAYPPSL